MRASMKGEGGGEAGMSIDVHNHFYPRAYLDALGSGRFNARLSSDGGPDPILHYAGDYNILVPGHRDLDSRLEDMDRVGMAAHVLSLTTPGVHIEEARAGAELARAVNEEFATICRKHAGRFHAFAALPLQDPVAAEEELDFAVTRLGLHGATLFTNVDGRGLDHPSFEPLFTKAARLGTTLFVHPTSPDDHGPLADYRLVPLLGFLFDTTTAISRLIFAGVLDRHPTLRMIASHLGGTLPYVSERLDRGYRVYPEIGGLIPEPPSNYLARIHYDTVNFDPEALSFVKRSLGTERMLLGSDYPHQIGDMKRALAAIANLDLPIEDRAAILRENARALLGLNRRPGHREEDAIGPSG